MLTVLVQGAGTGPLGAWNMFARVRRARRRLVSRDFWSGASHGAFTSMALSSVDSTASLELTDLKADGLFAKTSLSRSMTRGMHQWEAISIKKG